MSNLIREQQDYLLNSLSVADVGMYYEGNLTTGNKHLVFKKLGIDLDGGDDISVKVLNAQAGQKKVITLTPTFLWDGEETKDFTITITKEPLYNGMTNEILPVVHTYTYTMKNFVTTTAGTLHNTDKDTIIAGLIALIAADVKLGANQVNTGACVVGTNVSQTLVLTALEFGVDFTVVNGDDFSQALTTAFKAPTLTYEQLMRKFSVKAEQEGQAVVLPISGTTYTHIQITQKTMGYETASASAYLVKEQIYNIYVPLASISIPYFTAIAVATGSPLAVPSMVDTGGSANTTLLDYLAAIGGGQVSIPVTGIEAEITALTIDNTAGGVTDTTVAAGMVVLPTAATNKTIAYVSSDTNVATVHASNGTITCVADGTCTITATTADGGFVATATITVENT